MKIAILGYGKMGKEIEIIARERNHQVVLIIDAVNMDELTPGNLGKAAQQVPPQEAEKQLKLTEAIISSMTREERRNPDILNASRRRRIARGSGVEVQDVNRVMKNFREAQKLMKTLQKTGGRGLPRLFG
jgi:signal recognition particle subunit SRP54